MEKGEVAQTGWGGLLGKAQAGPLLPPRRYSLDCTLLGCGLSGNSPPADPAPFPQPPCRAAPTPPQKQCRSQC